jgi:hypothetical protein
MSNKYYVARGNLPIIEMTLAEIRESIVKGELSAADLYCQKGAAKYERIGAMPEYAALAKKAPAGKTPPPPETLPDGSRPNSLAGQTSGSSQTSPSPRTYLPPRRATLPENLQWTPPVSTPSPAQMAPHNAANVPVGTGDDLPPSFWLQPARPSLRFWSSVSYTLASVVLTPLLGSLLIDANHRMAQERTWRTIPLFWCVVWGLYLLAVLTDEFIEGMQHWPWWAGVYCAMGLFWFFTCALPHRLFLRQQPNDIEWRGDWGRPLGFGFLAFVLYFSAFILSS